MNKTVKKNKKQPLTQEKWSLIVYNLNVYKYKVIMDKEIANIIGKHPEKFMAVASKLGLSHNEIDSLLQSVPDEHFTKAAKKNQITKDDEEELEEEELNAWISEQRINSLLFELNTTGDPLAEYAHDLTGKLRNIITDVSDSAPLASYLLFLFCAAGGIKVLTPAIIHSIISAMHLSASQAVVANKIINASATYVELFNHHFLGSSYPELIKEGVFGYIEASLSLITSWKLPTAVVTNMLDTLNNPQIIPSHIPTSQTPLLLLVIVSLHAIGVGIAQSDFINIFSALTDDDVDTPGTYLISQLAEESARAFDNGTPGLSAMAVTLCGLQLSKGLISGLDGKSPGERNKRMHDYYMAVYCELSDNTELKEKYMQELDLDDNTDSLQVHDTKKIKEKLSKIKKLGVEEISEGIFEIVDELAESMTGIFSENIVGISKENGEKPREYKAPSPGDRKFLENHTPDSTQFPLENAIDSAFQLALVVVDCVYHLVVFVPYLVAVLANIKGIKNIIESGSKNIHKQAQSIAVKKMEKQKHLFSTLQNMKKQIKSSGSTKNNLLIQSRINRLESQISKEKSSKYSALASLMINLKETKFGNPIPATTAYARSYGSGFGDLMKTIFNPRDIENNNLSLKSGEVPDFIAHYANLNFDDQKKIRKKIGLTRPQLYAVVYNAAIISGKAIDDTLARDIHKAIIPRNLVTYSTLFLMPVLIPLRVVTVLVTFPLLERRSWIYYFQSAKEKTMTDIIGLARMVYQTISFALFGLKWLFSRNPIMATISLVNRLKIDQSKLLDNKTEEFKDFKEQAKIQEVMKLVELCCPISLDEELQVAVTDIKQNGCDSQYFIQINEKIQSQHTIKIKDLKEAVKSAKTKLSEQEEDKKIILTFLENFNTSIDEVHGFDFELIMQPPEINAAIEDIKENGHSSRYFEAVKSIYDSNSDSTHIIEVVQLIQKADEPKKVPFLEKVQVSFSDKNTRLANKLVKEGQERLSNMKNKLFHSEEELKQISVMINTVNILKCCIPLENLVDAEVKSTKDVKMVIAILSESIKELKTLCEDSQMSQAGIAIDRIERILVKIEEKTDDTQAVQELLGSSLALSETGSLGQACDSFIGTVGREASNINYSVLSATKQVAYGLFNLDGYRKFYTSIQKSVDNESTKVYNRYHKKSVVKNEYNGLELQQVSNKGSDTREKEQTATFSKAIDKAIDRVFHFSFRFFQQNLMTSLGSFTQISRDYTESDVIKKLLTKDVTEARDPTIQGSGTLHVDIDEIGPNDTLDKLRASHHGFDLVNANKNARDVFEEADVSHVADTTQEGGSHQDEENEDDEINGIRP